MAYARTFPEIYKHIEKKNFVILREQPTDIVSRLDNPGIAAFSTYVWNFEMSVAVARLIQRTLSKLSYHIWWTSNTRFNSFRRFF